MDAPTIEQVGTEAKKIYVEVTDRHSDSRIASSVLLSALGIMLINAPTEALFRQYRLTFMETIMNIKWIPK